MSTLKRIYLFSGDEPLLLQEAVDDIFKQAKSQGFSQKTRLDDSTFNAEYIQSLTANFSLFSDQHFLLYEAPKVNEALGKTVKALLADADTASPPNPVMIITCPRLTPAQMKTAWHKAIEKQGISKRLWPVTLDKMPSWINTRARALGLTLDRDATQLLANRCENNLLAAKQALDKLQLAGHTSVDLPTLEAHLIDQGKFDVYQLCDAALNGDTAKALRILPLLFHDKVDATVMIWALTKDLRLIATLQQHKSTVPMTMLFKKHAVWPNRQPTVNRALAQLPYDKCLTLLQQAAELDLISKGLAPGDIQFAMQAWLVQF